MGRFLRKRKGETVGEIAVVGVRTRTRAALATAATSESEKNIRNVYVNELSKRRRRRSTVASEKAVSFQQDTTPTNSVLQVAETAANCPDFPATSFCCASNTDRLEISADLQVSTPETSPRCFDSCRPARRERSSGASDGQDSPPKSTAQIKMPSDSEIEDFFSGAENDIRKRFADKYNFDIVKDVPLEGRYEWSRCQ